MFRGFGTLVQCPLAQTGEGISECELIQWFVEEGQEVHEFDKLCEVQSDKANIEITSRYKGVVRKLHHSKGELVKVGAPLVDIELPEGASPSSSDAAAGSMAVPASAFASASAPPPAPPHEAAPGGGGDAPQRTATCSVNAALQNQQPANGGLPSPSLSSATAAAVAAVAGDATTHAAQAVTRVAASSPAVRTLARQLGIDLGLVPGTGPGGRITKEDVLKFQGQAAPPAAPQPARGGAPSPPAAQPPAVPPSVAQDHRIPLRGYRRAMVVSMTASQAVPHFHYSDEFTVDALLTARAALKADPLLLPGGGQGQAPKLTLLPFLIKALSLAMSEHPLLNSSLAPAGDEILVHGTHNVGVAMATPNGLVVPNIKHVQQLSVTEVAHELGRLQQAAAANKLSTADLEGGTITVSNIGSIGGVYASPLVKPPETAIVALGRVRTLPRFDAGGAVVPRSLLGVSWGADHRVLDGAALAAASNSWKSLVEQPLRLLLALR